MPTSLVNVPRMNIIRLFSVTNDVVDQLRGGTTLRALVKESVFGRYLDLYEPVDSAILIPPKGIVFAELDALVGDGNWDLLQNDSRLYSKPWIVDIHFPFWDHKRIFTIDDKTNLPNTKLTQTAQQFWSNPNNQQRAQEIVSDADIVTSPHIQWVRYLRRFNRNVIWLSDVHGTQDALQFCRKLVPLIRTQHDNAMNYPWSKRLVAKVTNKLFNWYYQAAGEPALYNELEKLNWKF